MLKECSDLEETIITGTHFIDGKSEGSFFFSTSLHGIQVCMDMSVYPALYFYFFDVTTTIIMMCCIHVIISMTRVVAL